ncbi:MAG: hypothetical protein EX258_01510 [Sphingomonadaceae bacterium]|nr:MAG: hypothetical protein EX258_01510 [Sphingomonadaceae bacterium]
MRHFALIFAVGCLALSGPAASQKKGGGKPPKDDPTAAGPASIAYIAPGSRKTLQGLEVADDAANGDTRLFEADIVANNVLHDIVKRSPSSGRALMTVQSEERGQELIAVDFSIDPAGKAIATGSRVLTVMPDWGCEALSEDGSIAIYSPYHDSKIYWRDADGGPENVLWSGPPGEEPSDCELNLAERTVHTVMVKNVNSTVVSRLVRIDLDTNEVTTLIDDSRNVRSFALDPFSNAIAYDTNYDGGVWMRPNGTPSGEYRIATQGSNLDFFCEAGTHQRLLYAGREKNRFALRVFDTVDRTDTAISTDRERHPRTIC